MTVRSRVLDQEAKKVVLAKRPVKDFLGPSPIGIKYSAGTVFAIDRDRVYPWSLDTIDAELVPEKMVVEPYELILIDPEKDVDIPVKYQGGFGDIKLELVGAKVPGIAISWRNCNSSGFR